MTDSTSSAIRATTTEPLQQPIEQNRSTIPSINNNEDMYQNASQPSEHFHHQDPHSAAIQYSPGAYEQAPGGPHVHEAFPMSEGEKQYEKDAGDAAYPLFSGDKPWGERSWWYELIPFRGMYYDFRRRLPFFVSDWTNAFLPKNWWTIFQYVIRMYFINLMPALSYILDMNHRTNGAYGVNEVILASALAAIVFPIFSIQPLTFVGVTGLINLVNYTQYDIVVGYYGLSQIDYLRVQAWSLIWAAGFHFIVSIFNLCDFTRFITDMTSQTFGFYVGIVYIQKGIELLLLEYEPAPLDNATGWLSVTIAILFTVSVYLVTKIGQTSFLPFKMRYFVSSFAFVAGVIFWTGFSNFPDHSLRRVPLERLPITKSFFPTMDRPWFIDFWNIELRWIFVGAPLGFLIMLLFYFDHNVSSVMAQSRAFPVKRPAGFHWDFFLLGITTFVSGILGLPAPNGLVPQCPWSTDSLSVYKQMDKPKNDEEDRPLMGEKGKVYTRQHIVNTRVVENRLGHLAVGLLTIGTMTRPLLVVLGTMPRALFAGIFILVGWSSIEGNGITTRTLAIFKDRRLSKADDPLLKVKRSKIALYVGIQWIFFALTIAISQTIAAIGFPVIIVLLIPFRYWIVPLWFSPRELRVLDAPTADADVVLASIGHETESVTGQGMRVARDTKIAGTEWNDDDDDDEDYDGSGEAYEHRSHEKRPTSSTLNFGARNSNIKGYTIGDADEEDENEDSDDQFVTLTNNKNESGGSSSQGLKVIATGDGAKTPDVDPEGHYRAWLKGPLSTNADIEKDRTEALGTEPVPLKEARRSKSVTQSWWGKGGQVEAVERAPTPHTPATPGGTDESGLPSTPVGTVAATSAAAGGGFGLKKWLSSKKNQSKTTEGPAADTAADTVPVDNAQSSTEPVPHAGDRSPFAASPVSVANPQDAKDTTQEPITNDVGTAISQEPSTTRHQASDSVSTANLFLGGGLSPSEAGAAAAGAVRNIQSSTDDTPIYHSMIPNVSDTPGQTAQGSIQGPTADNEGHGHAVMSAVKDIVPDAKANATAVVDAVKQHIPGLGSESKSDAVQQSTSAEKVEKVADGNKDAKPVEDKPAPVDDKEKEVVAKPTGSDEKEKERAEKEAALMLSQVEEKEDKKLEKEKKELEKAKLKEQKVEAKRAAKEEKQKEKAEARQKKEDAKRMKEEEALQAILAKQANARAESEKKRRELDEKIKSLEGGSKSQISSPTQVKDSTSKTAAAVAPVVAAAVVAEKAAKETKPPAAVVRAPKIISKNQLKSLSDQVAGHEAAVYTTQSGDLVVKPCLPTEAEFYQSALIKHPSGMNKSQSSLLSRLARFMPTYHGTVDIVDDSNVAATRAVILENLTKGYKHANVLDIKLGKQLWDESASAEKRARMEEASKTTTSGTTGIRLTGWQVWDANKSQYVKVGKNFGKSIKVDQLDVGLRSFFGVGSDEDAQIVSKFDGSSQEQHISLPVKTVERILSDGILPALKEIHDIVKKLEWRAHGASLLIVYEGDPDALQKGAKKSFPRCGRTQKQKDDILDVEKLSNDTQSQAIERLADVRLIDFAHTSFVPGKGHDQGYLSGIDTTRSLLERLAKDARKGKLGVVKKVGITAVAVAPIAAIASKESSKDKDEKIDEKKAAESDKKEVAAPVPVVSEKKEEAVAPKADNQQPLASTEKKEDTIQSSETMKAEEPAAIAAAPILAAAAIPLAMKEDKEVDNKTKDEEKDQPTALTQAKQKREEDNKAKEKDNKPRRFSSIFGRKDKSEKAVQKEEEKKVSSKDDAKPAMAAAVLPIATSSKDQVKEDVDTSHVSKDAPVLPKIETSDNKATNAQDQTVNADAKKNDALGEDLVGAVGAGATIGAGSILLGSMSNEKATEDEKTKEKTDPRGIDSVQSISVAKEEEKKVDEVVPTEPAKVEKPKAEESKVAPAPTVETITKESKQSEAKPAQEPETSKEVQEDDEKTKEKEVLATAGAAGVTTLAAATAIDSSKDKKKEEIDKKAAKKEAKEARKESSETNSEKRKSRLSSIFTSTGNRKSPQPSTSEAEKPAVKPALFASKSSKDQTTGPSFSGSPSGGLIDTRAPQEIEDERQKEVEKESESNKQGGLAALLGPLAGGNSKKHEKEESSNEKGSSFSAKPAGAETTTIEKDLKPSKKTSKIGLFGLKKKSADEDNVGESSKAANGHQDQPPATPIKDDVKEPVAPKTEDKKAEDDILPGAAGAAILAAPAIAIAKSHKEDEKVNDKSDVKPAEEPPKAIEKDTLATDSNKKPITEDQEESSGLFGLIRRKTKKGKDQSDSTKAENKFTAEVAGGAALIAKKSEDEKALKEETAKAEAAAKKANAEAEKARLEAKKAHEEAEKVHKGAEKIKEERQKIHQEAEEVKKERKKAHEEAEEVKKERKKAHEEAEKVKKERQKAEEALKKAEKLKAKDKSDKPVPIPIPIPLGDHDKKSSNEIETKEGRSSSDLKSTKSTKRKSGLTLFGFGGGGKKSEENNKSLPVPPKVSEIEKGEETQSKSLTPTKKDEADGSALDSQIPPEILAAIERGDGKDIPPPTPTKDEKKFTEMIPAPVEKGKSSSNGNKNESAPIAQQSTSRDEGHQNKLTSFFSRGGGGASALGRSLTQKKQTSSEPHPAAVVEEVIEETEHGTQKFIRVTNPPRGAGKSASAVQWRDPS